MCSLSLGKDINNLFSLHYFLSWCVCPLHYKNLNSHWLFIESLEWKCIPICEDIATCYLVIGPGVWHQFNFSDRVACVFRLKNWMIASNLVIFNLMITRYSLFSIEYCVQNIISCSVRCDDAGTSQERSNKSFRCCWCNFWPIVINPDSKMTEKRVKCI